jgi:peptide/nickel transport system substrate-binding protein
MNRRDHGIVAGLILVLALVVGALAAPAFAPPAPAASPSPSPSSLADAARPYREGIIGSASSINPLTAVTAAERDLVALLFEGLVGLGPGDTLVPALAADWTSSEDGLTWTFRLRADARWHDGAPVTAHDVAWTIGVLQDPAYAGPGGASWRDVTVSEVDERTVQFQLTTALGGFLQAATQPIVPAHILEGTPVELLVEHPFNRAPVGSAPFRLEVLDDAHAVLVPATADDDGSSPDASRDPLTGGGRSSPSPRASPLAPPDPAAAGLPGIELWFYPDPPSMEAAWIDGAIDAMSGLSPADAARLGEAPGARVLRYPTTTLTAVVFNLRASRPEFRDPRVRFALLTGTDRAAIIDRAWSGFATRSDVPIPSGSWAYDGSVHEPIIYDRRAATRGLADAGWKAEDGSWTLPGGSDPVRVELLSPDLATNASTFLAAATLASHWERLGLTVDHQALTPAELVTERLRPGSFAAAVVDINIGLDPDLYPLLASTQITSQGLNVAGLQDPTLDRLLSAARAPGTEAARRAAYRSLQEALVAAQYVLPIAFRDEVVVVRDTVEGPAPRLISSSGDRFWDVLTWRLASDR